MKIAEICNRDVVVVGRDMPVRDAALLMREQHVGDLVVVDAIGGRNVPVGVVTDRDVTIEVVAMGVDPEMIKVGEVMGSELVTAGEAETVYDTIQRMRQRGVRRVPVVDAQGGLAGIVSLADLLEFVAEEITQLAKVFYREQSRESESLI